MTKVIKKIEKTFLRVFNWKFTTKVEADLFDQFQKRSIWDSRNPSSKLLELVKSYMAEKKNKLAFELVTEAELIRYFENVKSSVSRRTLNQWREADIFNDEKGNRLWATDGRGIVYNFNGVKAFIETRNK